MLTAAVVIVFHALGAVSAVHAVMSTRTSQGAIAWAVSLVTFPYLAVPAYWVLGRSKFQGYVMARRDTDVRNEYIEIVADVGECIERLEESQRLCLLGPLAGELTFRQAAAIHNLSLGQFKHRYEKAIAKVRDCMKSKGHKIEKE